MRSFVLLVLVSAGAAPQPPRAPAGAALQPPRAPARPAATTTRAAPERVEVCLKKHCRKRGGAATLALFESLAPDGVEVLAADMAHTEHGCFDECTMGASRAPRRAPAPRAAAGPNVRVDGEPREDGGRVLNGVRGAAAVAGVLGVAAPPA